MSDIAISCEGLSKQYRIGEQERYKALRDVITDAATSPFRRLRSALRNSNGNGTSPASADPSPLAPGSLPSAASPDTRHPTPDTRFWALQDVSFEVKRGEVVGIIGRNGAGKSTLLKILSRITKPTKGHATINGRVGSLLEVGTGFHSELTGRENIYLNAAILGMRRAEVERKFDEIVAFAEVEKFIDTPVKRYSSGMYVRLAFAVAAHMETEVLLVDEVLAVGDAQFQEKCFEKMRSIRNVGRTILFVSHNMSAIRQICQQGIELETGRIYAHGEIGSVVDAYLARTTSVDLKVHNSITPNFNVTRVTIRSTDGQIIKAFAPVEIAIQFSPRVNIKDPGVYVSVLTPDNIRITGLDFKDFRSIPPIPAGQTVEIGFLIESLPLLAGTYQLEIHLKDMAKNLVDFVPGNFQFVVAETPVYGGRKLDGWFGHVGLRAKAIARGVEAAELVVASDYQKVNSS
jgi:lipopolysaccharide transport system ATP-binding protein